MTTRFAGKRRPLLPAARQQQQQQWVLQQMVLLLASGRGQITTTCASGEHIWNFARINSLPLLLLLLSHPFCHSC
jgi:hypothetical protein